MSVLSRTQSEMRNNYQARCSAALDIEKAVAKDSNIDFTYLDLAVDHKGIDAKFESDTSVYGSEAHYDTSTGYGNAEIEFDQQSNPIEEVHELPDGRTHLAIAKMVTRHVSRDRQVGEFMRMTSNNPGGWVCEKHPEFQTLNWNASCPTCHRSVVEGPGLLHHLDPIIHDVLVCSTEENPTPVEVKGSKIIFYPGTISKQGERYTGQRIEWITPTDPR